MLESWLRIVAVIWSLLFSHFVDGCSRGVVIICHPVADRFAGATRSVVLTEQAWFASGRVAYSAVLAGTFDLASLSLTLAISFATAAASSALTFLFGNLACRSRLKRAQNSWFTLFL